MKEPKIDAAN